MLMIVMKKKIKSNHVPNGEKNRFLSTYAVVLWSPNRFK